MQLTRKASYGLIAAVALARHADRSPMSARSLATEHGLPAPFVEKILNQMKRAGLVTARPGRGGGYLLAHAAEAISVRDVLRALGEPVDLVQCLDPQSHACHLADSCPTRSTWSSINDRFQSLLAAWTLEDLNHARTSRETGDDNAASARM